MKEIQLTRGMFALVDDEDFVNASRFKWYASSYKGKYYGATDFNFSGTRLHLKLHQFIMGEIGIDHIDRNGLNCQKYNMRKCTQHQNVMNSSGLKNKTSKYKGVHLDKMRNRWITQITFNGVCKHLGSFKNEIEAAKRYDQTAEKLYGEYAYLNFKT